MDAHHVHHGTQGADKEVAVFEETQKSKVDAEGNDEQSATLAAGGDGSDADGDEVINDRRGHHEQEEAPIPPAVKEIAGAEEQGILAAPTESPVEEYNRHQKQEINGSIKKHI